MVSLKAADTFQLIKSLCCRHLGQDRMACLLITPEYSSGTSVNTGLGCSHTIPSDTTLFDKLYLLTTSRSFYKNLIMLSLFFFSFWLFVSVCVREKYREEISGCTCSYQFLPHTVVDLGLTGYKDVYPTFCRQWPRC